jgi:hypothetical protein
MCSAATLTSYTPYITAFGGAIGGGVISFFVGVMLSQRNHENAIKLIRRQEFNRAAAIFHVNVLNELEGLYPIPTDWPDGANATFDRFQKLFPKLQIAVAEFKFSLPDSHRVAFEKTWLIYRVGGDGDGTDKQDYWQYMPHLGTSSTEIFDSRNTYQADFKHNVDNLLKFAELT